MANKLVAQAFFPIVYRLLEQAAICCSCLRQFPLIDAPFCHRCGRPMAGKREGVCGDCQRFGRDSLTQNRSLFTYNEWGKALISRFKYRGDERLAQLSGCLLSVAFYRYYADRRFQIIANVPLHRLRLEERGFNQTQKMTEILGKNIKVPVLPLLDRVKSTDKLSKTQGKAARFRSMKSAFRLNPEPFTRFQGRTVSVLLIDDIYTTGSTIRSCADTILYSGVVFPVEVCSLTLFR
ncbi:ComF family protein [Brevibacillus fulvus]|uniref:Competence protein ComFC n=1 Tax=Brevibacillus fulvus TaxID=1125967 RepID=A0A939BW74_9BACL|nr:ComF family protein [Brevibacillus fulvus]MBM7591511.1 competence protein ComFC [Brevibacillus fulvus]